jgi:ribosomal protein S18 acetylase RimI-like enzyme
MTLRLGDLTTLGLQSTRLGADDLSRVTELCRQCVDFFELATGDSNPVSAASDLLQVGPPAVPPQRKFVLGFEREARLVGVADLIQDFPGSGEWYVGLLLLVQQERSRGLGRGLWTELESWLRSSGARAVRLVVQEQNPRGAAFWTSLGFVREAQVSQVLPTRTNVCWKFTKRI